MASTDGAKRRKLAPGPSQPRHKRLADAYVAEIVAMNELLRFVHSHGLAARGAARYIARATKVTPGR
jgi:hypothetical protein